MTTRQGRNLVPAERPVAALDEVALRDCAELLAARERKGVEPIDVGVSG